MIEPHLRNRARLGAVIRTVAISAWLACISFGAARVGDTQKTVVQTTKLESKVLYQFSRQVGPGRVRKAQTGEDGYVKKIYLVKFHGGKRVSTHLVDTEVKQPVDTIMAMGRAGFAPSRSSFRRSEVRTMIATGYDPSPETNGGNSETCTGLQVKYGCIAVDPRVIKLGTLMYVEGYGFGLACDKGSAIKGNRIDLAFDLKRDADRYGKRPVKVHLFKDR
jgi:3D (Asp-Asp-Asp) domain-containing protein